MTRNASIVLLCALLLIPAGVTTAQVCTTGSPITGTYGGPGETGNAATGSGPWTMDATATMPAWVWFLPDQTFTFAELTHLSATFDSFGNYGLGSPRFQVWLDCDGDGQPDNNFPAIPDAFNDNMMILWGPSNGGTFSGTDVELDTHSGVNYIGEVAGAGGDAGRYDVSQYGGSGYTTYNGALGTVGTCTVIRVQATLDNYDAQGITLTSINMCATGGPDLVIDKEAAGPFEGGTGSYTLTVSNVGLGPTDGSTVTVTDTPGFGVVVTNMSGTGWTCTTATRTCTRSDVLAAGASYPPITVDVTYTTNPIENSATVSGGGDVDTTDNSDSVTVSPATATDVPALGTLGMISLALLLGAVAIVIMRGRVV
jgi:hypothetical protein